MISRPPKNVELSHKWYLKNFKYQEPEFYAMWWFIRGLFWSFSRSYKCWCNKKTVHDDPKFYVFQEINSASVFCSLPCAFFIVDNRVFADYFKDDILPSL